MANLRLSAMGLIARIVLIVGCLPGSPVWAASGPTPVAPAAAAPPPTGLAAAARSPRKVSPYKTVKLTENAKRYYISAWGIDGLKVNYTASGNLIRFSYRVDNPERAKVLADKAMMPYMLGQRSRALLQVPVMDKVGMLRQSAAPQAGQEYWMVFSNKGNLVRPGDRVNVIIGSFHADGLMVE